MKGFDVNCKLSYEKALEFKNLGYDFVIRYVGREKKTVSKDIDAVEKNNILRAGLGLGIVQHCPPDPGIIPSASTGALWGKNAVIYSREAEYEEDCVVYLDLEDIAPEFATKKQFIYDFGSYWYEEALKGDYSPGVYNGFDTYLTSEELYYKLRFKYYWKSFSNVPDVYKRGYSMFQKTQIKVNGIFIDPDEMMPDRFGLQPKLMMPKKLLKSVIRIYSDGSYEGENV